MYPSFLHGFSKGSLSNTNPAAIDPKLWAAVETVLAAPVCSDAEAVNYNPTMEHPVEQSNVQNLFCVHMLITARSQTGKAYKDTSETLRYFPGTLSTAILCACMRAPARACACVLVYACACVCVYAHVRACVTHTKCGWLVAIAGVRCR